MLKLSLEEVSDVVWGTELMTSDTDNGYGILHMRHVDMGSFSHPLDADISIKNESGLLRNKFRFQDTATIYRAPSSFG